MASWALQDAKGRFSEVVERARRDGPQTVTKRGQAAVVVVAVEQFRALTRRDSREDLVNFFGRSPLQDLNPLWLDRNRDAGRELDL